MTGQTGQMADSFPARFSIAQAARATGRSSDTIRRAIKAGRLAAVLNATGAYEMSAGDLLTAGYVLIATDDTIVDAQHDAHTGAQAHLESELSRVRAELEAERRRAEYAEALLDRTMDALTAMTRALAAGPEPESAPTAPSDPSAPNAQPRRKWRLGRQKPT